MDIDLNTLSNLICNNLENVVKLLLKNLDNCTDDAQSAPEEDKTMAYSKQRVLMGHNNGKPVYRYIEGSSQDERDIEVVKAFIQSGRILDLLPKDYFEYLHANKKSENKSKHNFFKYIWDWYHLYKESVISTKYKATLIGRINVLCKFFGGYYIEDIKTQDVQLFLSSKDNISTDTLKYYKNVLSQVFESALEDEIIFKNPAKSKRLVLNGIETDGNKSLSMDECNRLIALLPNLQDKRETLAIAFMLLAGLRREEMLGLMWEDIDFGKKVLRVERAVVICNNGQSEVKPPKNKSSRRTIPMSDLLVDIISPHRQESGFIVTDTDGSLFIDRHYKSFWNTLKKHIGLPKLKAPVLRHTYATMNVAAGVDIKTLGHTMGHTKYSTTAEIYTQYEPVHAMNVRNNMADYIATHNIGNVRENVGCIQAHEKSLPLH